MDEISYSGTPAPKRKISRRTATFGLVGLLVLILVLGLIFFITRNSSAPEETSISLPPTEEPIVTQDETPTPEEETTSTPTKAPTKAPTSTSATKDITVSVLNGSGESGVAGKASDALKSAGYTVSSTGNADNFDYIGVTIQVKASEKNILATLKSDLEDAGYTVSSATSDLSEGQSYDALVIVGK